MSLAKLLWVNKYQPNLSEYVFSDNNTELKIKEWKEEKCFPNLLFYGTAGTGKSSLSKILIKEFNISDYLVINASNYTSVDDMREVIEYVKINPIENFKVVILEECDRLSKQAQDSLKTVIEEVYNWCRFIFITNEISRVALPIRSRCNEIYFGKIDLIKFTEKLSNILKNEKINFNEEVLVKYVSKSYPDLRKAINLIQENSINNVLQNIQNNNSLSKNYTDILNNYRKTNNLNDFRKYLSESLDVGEYEEFYKFMYNFLPTTTDDKQLQEKYILIIAEYLYKHSQVALPEINLTACLIKLFS